MTKLGCSGYSLSHQLFYFMFADMVSEKLYHTRFINHDSQYYTWKRKQYDTVDCVMGC